MNITSEVTALVEQISAHANTFALDDAGNKKLRMSLADHMAPFNVIMTSTNETELDDLCDRYPGFYRFGKMLEDIALGNTALGNTALGNTALENKDFDSKDIETALENMALSVAEGVIEVPSP